MKRRQRKIKVIVHYIGLYSLKHPGGKCMIKLILYVLLSTISDFIHGGTKVWWRHLQRFKVIVHYIGLYSHFINVTSAVILVIVHYIGLYSQSG